MSPAGFRCRRRRRPNAPVTVAENDAEALPLNAIETAPSNVRRPMIERVLADLKVEPDAPGAVAERVAYRLAGERAVRELEAGAAGTGNIGELLAWQHKRQAQLALEYVAKVAHIRGTTQRDALEAERMLRAAEETER